MLSNYINSLIYLNFISVFLINKIYTCPKISRKECYSISHLSTNSIRSFCSTVKSVSSRLIPKRLRITSSRKPLPNLTISSIRLSNKVPKSSLNFFKTTNPNSLLKRKIFRSSRKAFKNKITNEWNGRAKKTSVLVLFD